VPNYAKHVSLQRVKILGRIMPPNFLPIPKKDVLKMKVSSVESK